MDILLSIFWQGFFDFFFIEYHCARVHRRQNSKYLFNLAQCRETYRFLVTVSYSYSFNTIPQTGQTPSGLVGSCGTLLSFFEYNWYRRFSYRHADDDHRSGSFQIPVHKWQIYISIYYIYYIYIIIIIYFVIPNGFYRVL